MTIDELREKREQMAQNLAAFVEEANRTVQRQEGALAMLDALIAELDQPKQEAVDG